MSEPNRLAEEWNTIVPGLHHWGLADDRIEGHRSEAYAIESEAGTILIDPLPLAARFLQAIKGVIAICITNPAHQRSAWRYRRQFEVPVWAPPPGRRPYEETPDECIRTDRWLPGYGSALAAPGPFGPHFVFEWNFEAGRALFLSDLVMRSPETERLVPLPEAQLDDAAQARTSLQQLARRNPRILCPGHGPPLVDSSGLMLRRVLDH